LDDALDKLARRDELRRRAAGEATGTPPAVAELVEAIAAVVGRNPELGVTVGVEGAGDPVLLHFAVEGRDIVFEHGYGWRHLKRYKPGRTVDVWIDPDNPDALCPGD
jgi:hypothetical protein